MSSPPTRSLAELAFALLPGAFVVVDTGGEPLYTSPGFDRIFPAGGASRPVDDFRAAIGDAPGGEARFERDGRTWRARLTENAEAGVPVRLWSIEDVSAEAGALKARDEYLSMIVHDLRGPLAGIRGTVDFVLEDPDVSLPDMHRDLVREARDEADRMMNLVNEILDFAKIRAGKFRTGVEKVATAMVVRRAVLGVRSLAQRERMTVESDVPRNIPPLAANGEKLLQVLNNLLVNAFKFTPAGGVIVVSAESHRAANGEGRVLLAVTDTGPGIPLEKQDELFRRFGEVGTASDKDIAGTGLGLFITKAIVEAFDGTIGFASVPGVGTSFVVDLPAWDSGPEGRA